ncbi:hypothetical protein SAMN02910263_03865 [Butyrivibrio sp. INlla16]|nr:hypothetical protein SAMN02910263_03865 [Butyrivibrio sp. INlla16]
MDIRDYDTALLPYHFVLFFDLPIEKLLIYKILFQGQEEDNALLTYCYVDSNYGISYKAICWVTIQPDGSTVFHRQRRGVCMLTLREGSISCKADVLDEAFMPSYADDAEEIRNNYGCSFPNKERYYNRFRHPIYSTKVYTIFMTANHKHENIWVDEQCVNDDGSIMASLSEEPQVSQIGLHKGELVHVVIRDVGNGLYAPFAVLDWMKK